MISQEQLQELLSFQNERANVLSLYLDANNKQESIDAIKLQARSLLKEVPSANSQDAEAIEKFLDHGYDWSKPGLAVFSSNGGQFFRAFPANVAFRNRLRIAHKPYVKPLAHLLDYYAHYGVIVVDKVGARFFEYHLGELQSDGGFLGEDVHKIKKGRGSSAVGMRGGVGGGSHEAEVARRNLREAAEEAGRFFQSKPIRRLFLGGTSETVAQFQEFLPKQLQSCVAGTFQVDMNAGEHEVREITLKMLQEANEVRERKLVEKMLAAANSGGNGVTGLDDTLQAVSDRRVQVLIISDGFHTPGYLHPESGFVVANLTKSPFAESQLTAVDDVVDAAVSLVMSQGGHVEVIADNPELKNVGQIGAILRY